MKQGNFLERLNCSRLLTLLVFAGIFGIMLLCNLKTPMVADDYAYCFSFADGQRIESLGDCFTSMIAHRQWMNGRVIAHFFVQLFLMLPLGIFKVINSLVFTAVVYLLLRITGNRNGGNNLLLIGIFCCIWIFMPSFGQVVLWLDGAVNYLWSVLLSLAMLSVYVSRFFGGGKPPAVFQWLFPAFSFAVGAYSEPSAAAVIFCCGFLLALDFFLYKKRPCRWLAAALLSSFAGFLFMILAPGEISNKSATLTISGISYGFVNSMELYRQIWLLLALYLALAIAAWHDGAEPRRQLLALSFMLASVAAVFVLSFAGYAEGRSACFGCIMAIAAVGTLFPAVYRSRFKPALCFAVSLGLVVTMYWGAVGLQDICESCAQQERNRQLILSARESGAGSVSLEPVYFATKYTAGHGLTYLTANSSDWVNSSMARYYGIDSISLNN